MARVSVSALCSREKDLIDLNEAFDLIAQFFFFILTLLPLARSLALRIY